MVERASRNVTECCSWCQGSRGSWGPVPGVWQSLPPARHRARHLTVPWPEGKSLPSLTEHYFYLIILAISEGKFFLKPDNCSPHLRFISVTFNQCCGSGSGIRCFLTPGSGIQDEHSSDSLETVFWVKNTHLNSLKWMQIWDPGSWWPWIRDEKIRIHNTAFNCYNSGTVLTRARQLLTLFNIFVSVHLLLK